MILLHFKLTKSLKIKKKQFFFISKYFIKKHIFYLTYIFTLLFPVPPHQILVYDASGRDVAGAVGPLFEGDNIVLTCEVRGGKLT